MTVSSELVDWLQDRLLMIVLGALRQHKYTFIDTYKEEAETAIKTVVKQVSPFDN